MDATGHTPGPWQAFVRQEDFKPTYIIDTDIGIIRPPLRMSYREIKANARLLEQVPEMIKAMEMQLEDGECYCLDKHEGGRGGICAHCFTKGVLERAILARADKIGKGGQ